MLKVEETCGAHPYSMRAYPGRIKPVPPNWFSSAESQVGWGGPNGLDPKVDPTFLSECVGSAGTEPFLKKGFPMVFLPTNPYMVMNCIFLASHVHLWFTFYQWWMVMILSSTKFLCRMDEGNWNFVLFHKMEFFILYVLVRFLPTLHIFLSFLWGINQNLGLILHFWVFSSNLKLANGMCAWWIGVNLTYSLSSMKT
jgi:hypothetical protein